MMKPIKMFEVGKVPDSCFGCSHAGPCVELVDDVHVVDQIEHERLHLERRVELGVAHAAELNNPYSIALSPDDSQLFILDNMNSRVR